MKSLQEKNQIEDCLNIYERLLNKTIYLTQEKYIPQSFHFSRKQEQDNEEINASLRILQIAFKNIKSAFSAESKQAEATITTHIMHL